MFQHQPFFIPESGSAVAGITSFADPSMREWVGTVLGECSHPEVNPRALSVDWVKSDGIWHQV